MRKKFIIEDWGECVISVYNKTVTVQFIVCSCRLYNKYTEK